MNRFIFLLPVLLFAAPSAFFAAPIGTVADPAPVSRMETDPGLPAGTLVRAENPPENGVMLSETAAVPAPQSALSVARSTDDEEIPFGKLYARYQKNKKQTEIAAELLLRARQFLSTCSDYERQKWSVRIEALFQDYVKNKGLENMINAGDFFLISRFHTDPGKNDAIFRFVADHYADYTGVADRREVSAYLIGLNNSRIIRLCKAGDKAYLRELDELDGSLREVYAEVKFGDLPVKEAISCLANATYCLYRNDENGFFTWQDRYFAAVGDSLSVDDYTQPLLEMYLVRQGDLSENGRRKAIEWCGKALEKEMSPALRTRLLIILGECYQGSGDHTKAKQAWNQAYLSSALIPDEPVRVQLQQAVLQNLQGL